MAYDPQAQEDHHDKNRYGALVSTLSLFIMLLAFFIMLNASADFDATRVRPVMQSIQETFTSRVFRDDVGPSLRPGAEQGMGDGNEAYNSLEAYFSTSFPGVQPKMIPTRGIFYLELPADEFERKYFSANSKLQKTLIEKMWAYQQLQMEIWLNIEDDPGVASGAARDELRAKMKKVTGWAAELEKEGLQHGTLTVGLQKGDPKKVIVLFHNYKPYAPAQ